MNIQDGHASKEEVHDAYVMWAKGENNMEDCKIINNLVQQSRRVVMMSNLSQMTKK
jgi:hypothetical protein